MQKFHKFVQCILIIPSTTTSLSAALSSLHQFTLWILFFAVVTNNPLNRFCDGHMHMVYCHPLGHEQPIHVHVVKEQ